ncbi:hypothetical protein KQI38_01055 [Tissierella carlieri]|uniref:sigma factor-like helix-turn-helix DNA-binding protein n=1 Tax=Tissierella carlieri TaxID=689904 RepID=UPI001C104A99|nr:sigma factor-like helix-turn-helix DNA-binding protein [Tissierella carlieri]MBU5310602.1 hypothetical protein [Tissierella carlieri]
MDIHLLINEKFDVLYKKNKRYVDICSDLNLNIFPSEIRSYLDYSNLYYKLSNKRYLKVEWIIDRMYEYLETEGYYIDNTIAEIIVRDVSKAQSINRKNLTNIFFSEIDIITKYELDLIRESICKKHKDLNIENKDKSKSEINIEKFYYKKFFMKNTFNSDLEKNIIITYNNYRIINEMGFNQSIRHFINTEGVNDIRDLCQACKFVSLDISINDVIDIIGYRRVGIFKIEPINDKDKNIHLSFKDSIDEFKKRIKSRDWDCYYNYVIDKIFTLEELGKIFNITRERVRQVIKKADRIVKREKHIFHPFKGYLEHIFEHLDYIYIDKLKESSLIIFGQSSDELEIELNLLNYLFGTKYHIFQDKIFNFDKTEIGETIVLEVFGDELVDCKFLKKEDLYLHIYNINFKEPRKVIRYLIEHMNNIIFSDTEEYVLIKRNRITNVDICKWILYNIGEPVHYSFVYERYCEYMKNQDMSLRSLHATLDRSEEQGIIRTFTGTYGLVELGAEKHVFARDLAIKVLKEYNRPMHYSEIIREVQKQSNVKDNTTYANLNTSPEIISNNDGVYALKIWKEKLDDSFQEKQVIERKLIKHGYNKFGNYAIKYLIKDNIFDDHILRLPSNIPIELNSIVKIVNTNDDEFMIKYYSKLNYFYRFDRVLSISNIKSREYIFLELISPDYIRVFKEHEYYMYLDGKLILSNKKLTHYNEEQDIDDILSIFYKDV